MLSSLARTEGACILFDKDGEDDETHFAGRCVYSDHLYNLNDIGKLKE